jgi:hypothetical protein
MKPNKPVGKLEVDKDGMLVEGKVINVETMDTLAKVEGSVSEGKIVLQPLAGKEQVVNGIILPAHSKEMKCGVIAAHENSKYKRGDVIMLKKTDFNYDLPVDYCEGHATLMLYESMIWYKYGHRIED